MIQVLQQTRCCFTCNQFMNVVFAQIAASHTIQLIVAVAYTRVTMVTETDCIHLSSLQNQSNNGMECNIRVFSVCILL